MNGIIPATEATVKTFNQLANTVVDTLKRQQARERLGQNGATYIDSGYSIPLELVKAAYPISETFHKRNKRSLARIFEQIAYLCLTTDERVAYKKQATLGNGCGVFDGKSISRWQVIRLEKQLVELGLYEQHEHPNKRFSWDRMLTPLGTVVYLLFKGLVKYSEPKKMSHRKQKNVTSQFLDHEGIKYLSCEVSASKSFDEKIVEEPIVCEEKVKTKVPDIVKKYSFDLPQPEKEKKIEAKMISSMSEIRKHLEEAKKHEGFQTRAEQIRSRLSSKSFSQASPEGDRPH